MRRTTGAELLSKGQRARKLFGALALSAATLVPLALSAATLVPLAHAGPRSPEPEAPLHRGAELVATTDLVLGDVQIAKGSRVTVAGVDYRDGKPHTVSLELKDGHVLHAVPFNRVKREFRPATS